MSDENVISAKCRLLELFSDLDDSEMNIIEQWIGSKSYKKDLLFKNQLLKAENKLIKIGDTIKTIVPLEAEMPSEIINYPTIGDQSDCNKVNTCHVDEFLYDENEVDKLVKAGRLTRHYCLDCDSRNVKELTYISHSMSRLSLQYLFKVLLPKDLEDKSLLDIGSRLGSVIFGAYYFSNASTIIGVEMNKECCDVQERIINEYCIDKNRVKVVNSDVLERSDIVANSNVIIISVLDFFVDNEKHKSMWYFLKKYIKKGSYLVTNRIMADTLTGLEIYDEFMSWLSLCQPNQLENEIFFYVEDCYEMYLYTVN